MLLHGQGESIMDQLGASKAQARIAAGPEPVKPDPLGRLRRGLTASSLTEPVPSAGRAIRSAGRALGRVGRSGVTGGG